MIEVVVTPSGDSAEADSPEAAIVAARTLLRDARQNGMPTPTASMFVDGVAIRSDLTSTDLNH